MHTLNLKPKTRTIPHIYSLTAHRNIFYNASASSSNADPRNPGPPKPGFYPGGAHFKTQRGRGGFIENIVYDNIWGDGVSSAISFSCLHGMGPVTNRTATPILRNITVKVSIIARHITATAR